MRGVGRGGALKRLRIAVCVLAVFCTSGAPGVRAGSLPLLLFTPGGRAGALAGAYTSVADDAEAVFYNPAGLSSLSDAEFGVMYTSLGQGFISSSHLVSVDLSIPSAGGYGVGVGLLYERRKEGSPPDEPYTLCATLSSGSAFGSNLAYGMGVKYLKSMERSKTASVFGGDVGVLLASPPFFLGFSMESWRGALDYGPWQEDPAGILRFGIAYKEPGSNAPVSVEYRRVTGPGSESYIHAGLEIPTMRRRLHLRGGYIRNIDSGDESFLIGAGFSLVELGNDPLGHPTVLELGLYDNVSAGGLRDIRVELRRRSL